MLEKIKEAAEIKVDPEKPQCFVLFVLSHGGIDGDGDEGPKGTDGKHLKKKDIVAELDSCRNLIGVPRIVFLQCCRGGRLKSSFFYFLSHVVWFASNNDNECGTNMVSLSAM